MASTLDVKIVWFGHQVDVCVKKQHQNAIFGYGRFLNFNFDCLLLELFICLPKTEMILNFVYPFVDLVIYHDLGDSNIFQPLFGQESQSMLFSENLIKSDSWFIAV